MNYAFDTLSADENRNNEADLAPTAKTKPSTIAIDDVVDLAPLAPTHDENKGFMRFMPSLIKEMNRKGVPFTLNGTTGEIQLSGFYRAQGVLMEIGEGDAIRVIDRRGTTPVKVFDDLVKLNFEWWTRSNARGENLNPDRPWLDEFLEKGWVKRQVVYVPREVIEG